MQYSTLVLWLEMAILIFCVVLSTTGRNKTAMWVTLAIVAHNVALATHDYVQTALALAICTLIYLGLLKRSPDAARVWLCLGGALAGALLLGGTGLSIIGIFQDGWNVFGLMIWAAPVFAAFGLLPGFWVVYRWTEPAEAGA
jgi:hypothetical protein